MIPIIPFAAAVLFVCASPRAIDGDTLACRGRANVRIVGIDAPEMPGHCRVGRICTPGDGEAARAAMARLIRRGQVVCTSLGADVWGRTLGNCTVRGISLGCAMIAAGQAVPRYSRIHCQP